MQKKKVSAIYSTNSAFLRKLMTIYLSKNKSNPKIFLIMKKKSFNNLLNLFFPFYEN
jgi:hypothetical protein